MPYRKRYTKKPRRRYKRRFRRKNLKSPATTTLVTKLRYNTIFEIDPGAAVSSAYVFSANGMYEPDITSIGHQPRAWDQFMKLYDHAVVLGAKITCRIACLSTGAIPLIMGIALRDNSTTYADSNNYLESGNVRSVVVPNDTSKVTTITYKVNQNKFLGRSKPLADPDLKNTLASNPEEQAFFHVFSQAVQDGDNGPPCSVNVNIDYIVAFIEPKIPTQS